MQRYWHSVFPLAHSMLQLIERERKRERKREKMRSNTNM
jgi:hypothetical protein